MTPVPRMTFDLFTRPLLGSLAMCMVLGLSAQTTPTILCTAHDDLGHLAPLHQNDPVRLAQMEAATLALELETQANLLDNAERGGNAYVLPVVFHVIHNNGPENISDEQLEDAIRVLNDDFNKLNTDWDNVNSNFLGLVADVGITFRLAQKDPNGNCTKGITRTQSILTNDGTQTMKNLIQWPRNKYLNVWVAASADGAAGYTLRPGSVANSWSAPADGIVLLHNYTGSIGTSSPGRSRTLTHEVGHWINLKHTWGGTNDPGVGANCSDDDSVSDTPNTIGWTNCNTNGNSCSSLDNVENFMEYSYCSKMFTNGQKDRMITALTSSTAQRNQLWQPANLTATGTNGTNILCAAEFTSDLRVVCEGDQVQFNDLSFNGVTDWNWVFNGATPGTSIVEDPLVTYNAPGFYSVSLVASNGGGTVSTSETDYIMVLPSTGSSTVLVDDFEAVQSLPNNDWSIENESGSSGFTLFPSAGYSGSNCVRLNNIIGQEGEMDGLLSTTIDMSNSSGITISFRHAFARRNSSNNDILRVYVSNNCGQSWSLRKQLYASSSLSTAIDQTATFIPSSQAQWGYTEITNISTTYHVSNFRVKFEFTNDGGNNLYLDDVNINGIPVGIEELITTDADGLSVIPNPATSQADLLLDLRQAGAVTVEIVDPVGRLVSRSTTELPAGEQRLALPLEGIAAGTYVVVVRQGTLRQTVRLVKR